MDTLEKENFENQIRASVKRGKATVHPFENIKKLKTIIKPLCDVKNIIEEKINVHQKVKPHIADCKEILATTEDRDNEDLFFFSEYEDNYEDIIPKSMQLEEDDISKLAAVFDNFPFMDVEVEKMEFLPYSDIAYTTDELCDITKGLDSSCLLFENIEFKVQF